MKALVTGGGGFLGSVIIRQLRERGDEVRSLARDTYPALESLGVEQFRGDIADKAAVLRAAAGCDTVFHVAAKAGIWGSHHDYYRTNVTGTENVLAACLEQKVPRLVYTSSPSVVFDGSDVAGGNELLAYPVQYEAHYPATKAQAERLVLAANSETLATVALRPHLIWGPGDNHLVPRIIAKGRAGQLRRIGTRPCLVDTVYVENAAKAHLQAADRLGPDNPVAGKAYFISNGEPLPLWELVNCILATADLPPVTKSISLRTALLVGTFCEKTWQILRLRSEPPMTRFMARELASTHWFDLTAARRDLGYAPQISIQEGLKRLRDSFHQASEHANRQSLL